MLKHIRHAVRETGRFLGRHYGTAIRYARAFDQGINMVGRFAQAVAPTIDSLAGTQATRQTRQLTDDYQLLRSKVMGVHQEGQHVGNHLMGNVRRNVPELGLEYKRLLVRSISTRAKHKERAETLPCP